jgi:spore germination cell wall hydrolase CwlJ-like protein
MMKRVASALLVSILTTWAFVSIAQAEISKRETYCLAQNIFFEARSESLASQAMIAEVTFNRALSKNFPNTICEVVWQRKQFSWTHDGKHDDPTRMSFLDREAWKEIYKAAELIINNPEGYLPKTGATHYHADYVRPYWASEMKYLGKVGSHLFYK